ncbi:MAG: DUF2262 domain-containing protein [Clostridium sp.]|nr:DUF2262 domain-containing protein [Clostridium sp.]MCM1208522.1 DUF2262 domain-containing protein [Ruminococcus sp.]
MPKKMNKNNDNVKSYEEIYKEFNSQFSEELLELLVYNEHMGYGTGFFQGIIEERRSNFLACTDAASGRIMKELGILTLPVDKRNYRKNKKIRLKDNTIYRVRVRKRCLWKLYHNGKLITTIDSTSEKHRINEYMLVDILDKKLRNEELETAAALAKEPVVIHTAEFGDFTMQRNGLYVEFSGQIAWLGEKCDVTLCPDTVNVPRTIDKSMEALKTLVSSMEEWDRKVKDFAADEMAEDDGMVYTWEGEEGETPVSKDEFKRRLSLTDIYIEPSGDICFSYELDEMFTDHGLSVEGNISGKMDSVSLDG